MKDEPTYQRGGVDVLGQRAEPDASCFLTNLESKISSSTLRMREAESMLDAVGVTPQMREQLIDRQFDELLAQAIAGDDDAALEYDQEDARELALPAHIYRSACILDTLKSARRVRSCGASFTAHSIPIKSARATTDGSPVPGPDRATRTGDLRFPRSHQICSGHQSGWSWG